jgi:DNA-binding MarR family transcriptional regulator
MAKQKVRTKDGLPVRERSPSHLLHRAQQIAADIYAREFGPGGITLRQYALLAAAGEREGATQTDLVRLTGIDRSTLAEMTARLIGKGMLERERSALDARANTVRLSEAGREALEAARPIMARVDSLLLGCVRRGKRRVAFLELLAELVLAGESAASGERTQRPRKPKAEKTVKRAVKTAKKAKKAA